MYVNFNLSISLACTWSLGALQRQQALQVHFGGTQPAICSQLPRSQDPPASGPKPARLPGCDTSPDQWVLRGRESGLLFNFFCFHPIIWTGVYSELQSCCFVFSFSFYHRLFHIDISVYRFLGGFLYRLIECGVSFLVIHGGPWSLTLSIVVCIY